MTGWIFEKKELSREQEEMLEKQRKLHEEHEELKKLVRNFLWSVVHHREKVPCEVGRLLELSCYYIPEDVRLEMREAIIGKLLGKGNM